MQNLYETSEQIVAGIGQGESKAEAAMVHRYAQTLLFVLQKRTGNTERARDLMQETFLVALQRLRTRPLDDPSKLSAFLQRTAINLFIGEHRKDMRRNTDADSELIESVSSLEPDQYQLLLKERSKFAIRRMLNELSEERDKMILTSYYLEDLDKAEICNKLNLTHRHFDRVLYRARNRFRELVGNLGEDSALEFPA